MSGFFGRGSAGAQGPQGPQGPEGPAGPPGAGASRLVALDENDLIQWKFNEVSGPFLNTGSGGTCSLAATGNITTSVVSLFNTGVVVNDSAAAKLCSVDTTVGEAPGGAVTLHGWVHPLGWTNAAGGFWKLAAQTGGGWQQPYTSLGWQIGSNSGIWTAVCAVGGEQKYGTVSQFNALKLNMWQHIAVVHNGLKLKGYINGNLAIDVDAVGDTDWSAHGPWCIGDNVNNSGQTINMIFDDWRVRSVAMTQEEIEEIYRRALGLYPANGE